MKAGRGRSLVGQTIFIVLAAQVLSAALLSGAALLHEWHARVRALDVRLQGRSDSLLGAIQDAEDPDDNVTIDPAELSLPADDVYAVFGQGGRLLGSSGMDAGALATRQGDGFRNGRLHDTHYRIYEREALRVIDRAENGGVGLKRPVTIVYASPDRHLWEEVFAAARFYLLANLIATSLAVLLVAVLVRSALSPLAELATAAAKLSFPVLDFQPPASVVRVPELRPLAKVLEEAVTRLRESFAKEQRFVGDAAHELKTALAVLRSSVQLLMLKPRSQAEYESGLAGVLEDNARVEALVGQMLLLAASGHGEAVQLPATDISVLVASTLAVLSPLARLRQVSLRFDPVPGLTARLFPDRGEILLSNLLVNAIQHSQPGREIVVVLASPGDEQVRLVVQDAGEGIAPSALPHVFERFYREDRSRSRDTGGAGLGLSICKSIVQDCGGEILIESSPGEGTRVTVLLRAA